MAIYGYGEPGMDWKLLVGKGEDVVRAGSKAEGAIGPGLSKRRKCGKLEPKKRGNTEFGVLERRGPIAA